MRKLLGLFAAVLALGAAAWGSRRVDTDRDEIGREECRRAAETASQRAADGLAVKVSDLKLKASNAAANPRLVFALEGNVDERTLRDLWRSEEWWRPWRSEFKVYALAFGQSKLDILEGLGDADLNAEGLIHHVRDRGEAIGEILFAKGWPYAAAATEVQVPGRQRPPVLVLAKPLDQATVRGLADKAGGAVMLTDGETSLIEAGPEQERALLKQALEARGDQPFVSPDGRWAAVPSVVAPGLSLWTYASGGVGGHEAQVAATERKLILWTIASVAALAGLIFGFRHARAAGPQTSTGMTVPRTVAGLGPSAAPEVGGNARDGGPGARLSDGRFFAQASTEVGHPAVSGASQGSTLPGVGGTFGRYTLLDRLGEGGMAEVYTAITYGAEGFRRKFVIKRLRPELAREPAVVDQFIDEANLASSMIHSNIVPVFDFGKVGDEYFLAQEYILGRDLARFTRRSLDRDGRALPYQAALHIVRETLKALEYAHTKTGESGEAMGIVHRDVSPANIIVSARGEVKLFDFGIVKAEGRVTKTQAGVVKGNVTFMSPEQARGNDVDGRADLFSLGLVLFYLLTGRVLYTGSSTYELLVKAATGPGPDEHARIAALPGPCGPLLGRVLQVKAADRYQTAHELYEALGAYVGDGAAELAALVKDLFAEDFKREEARFVTYVPSTPPAPVDPNATDTEPLRRRP